MKILVSELGQCIVFGIIFVCLATAFYQVLNVITGQEGEEYGTIYFRTWRDIGEWNSCNYDSCNNVFSYSSDGEYGFKCYWDVTRITERGIE